MTIHRDAPMSSHAIGTFEVRITPQAAEPGVGDPAVGRMALDKEFSGDLQAVSKGQMLALHERIAHSVLAIKETFFLLTLTTTLAEK